MNDHQIQMADLAERHICNSLAALTSSQAPLLDRVAGEIDLAYKLHLIDYPRRDALMGQLRSIVNHRRDQLRKQHHARLMCGIAK